MIAISNPLHESTDLELHASFKPLPTPLADNHEFCETGFEISWRSSCPYLAGHSTTQASRRSWGSLIDDNVERPADGGALVGFEGDGSGRNCSSDNDRIQSITKGANVKEFTISPQVLATAAWAPESLVLPDANHFNRIGQLASISEVDALRLEPVSEPPGVDENSDSHFSNYSMVSRSTGKRDCYAQYMAAHRSNISFSNLNLIMVYPTGVTRVHQ
jgi:hypothetical protein